MFDVDLFFFVAFFPRRVFFFHIISLHDTTTHTHIYIDGTCMTKAACTGVSEPGHCPGSSANLCCIQKSCQSNGQTGKCQHQDTCTGTTKSGLCPGSSEYKCCLGSAPSPETSTSNTPTSSPSTETSPASELPPTEVGEDRYPVLTAPGSTCPSERQITNTCMELHKSFSAECSTKRTFSDCPSSCKRSIDGGNFVCNEVAASRNVGYYQSRIEAPDPMSRNDILKRAMVWLNTRVRYSQLRYHSDPAIDDGLGYRTDCSGFVGMSWKMLAFSTSWMRGLLDQRKTTVFSGIPCKDMLPGDALVNNGHIVLFRKWVSKPEGSFLVWEEKGTNYGTVESTKTFKSWDPTSSAEGFKTKGSSSVYRCVKRANLAPDDFGPDSDPSHHNGDDGTNNGSPDTSLPEDSVPESETPVPTSAPPTSP